MHHSDQLSSIEPDVRIPLGDLRPPFMLPAMSTFLTLLVRSILLIKKKTHTS